MSFGIRQALKLQVLIVEDGLGAGDWVATMLRAYGAKVTIATSGSAALAAASQTLPDVVFMDLNLPDLDGFEVVRRMRQEPWAARAVFVAVTGRNDQDSRDKARAVGIAHYLVKPIATEKLLEILGQIQTERDAPHSRTRTRSGAA